jgi:ornithine cyclodeaminase/alanine dehydrogenase
MRQVIEAVEAAHAEDAAGRTAQPARTATTIPGREDVLIPMVAAIPALRAVGLKLFSDFPSNSLRSMKTQDSVVVLVNADTGACEALLPGGLITAYRTAAASAVATKYLAREDASVLGLVGAGGLALPHLEAIRVVRAVSRVVVWSRTSARSEEFARAADNQGIAIEIAASPEIVARSAEILCTLTRAPAPIVRGDWLSDGAHVNAVGSPPRLSYRELDTKAVVRSRVVVDSRESVREESGDLMIPVAEGALSENQFSDEIGEIIIGKKPGRMTETEVTLYKSVGVAIQDVATAKLVVDAARAAGVGHEVELG